MATLPGYDVFLSHNRRQKPWVRHVVAFLRERGLRVFFDEDSINPGEDIVSALERAVESSKSLVLVLSRSSVFSKWVAFETTLRIYDNPDSTLSRLIPILVEPIDRTMIRPAVRRLDAVDLTDPRTREAEFLHFLKSLGIVDVRPTQLPAWPEASAIEELYIADIRNVINWGWTGSQLLDKLIALDYQVFDALTDEHEGHAGQWSSVFMDHPDTWRLLITPDNEIVGYWHFVPLFPDDFQSAVSGVLKDSQITADRVYLFELPGRYPIYFVSFGLLPRFRRTKAYKLLLDSFFDVLLDLAKDGIFIDQVCANAFSLSGESMCKTFGMTYARQHSDRGRIYIGKVTQLLELNHCVGYKELRALYAGMTSRFPDDK
jgi:hypothetical protein